MPTGTYSVQFVLFTSEKARLSGTKSLLAGISEIMLVRLRQSLNAYSPILVTLFGIVMLVRLLQPKNVPYLIAVTLFGIVMLVSLLQL